MHYKREFEIPWFGLKEGLHQFDYEIDQAFFDKLGYIFPDCEDLSAKVHLVLEKHNSFLQLKFDIDGRQKGQCDRCGDQLEVQLWDEFTLIVKLTATAEEAHQQNEKEDADVVFLARTETIIDVSKWIYEFILLSIPLRKIHQVAEDGTSGCNSQSLAILEQMQKSESNINPIWKDLTKFKTDN